MSAKQSINDKIQGSVATYLSCGEVLITKLRRIYCWVCEWSWVYGPAFFGAPWPRSSDIRPKNNTTIITRNQKHRLACNTIVTGQRNCISNLVAEISLPKAPVSKCYISGVINLENKSRKCGGRLWTLCLNDNIYGKRRSSVVVAFYSSFCLNYWRNGSVSRCEL